MCCELPPLQAFHWALEHLHYYDYIHIFSIFILTFHECDSWVGLLARSGLSNLIHCLHMEGIHSVWLQPFHGQLGGRIVSTDWATRGFFKLY